MIKFLKRKECSINEKKIIEYEIKYYKFNDYNSQFSMFLLYKDEKGNTRKYSEVLYGLHDEVNFIVFKKNVGPKAVFEVDGNEKTLLKIILPDK